MSVTKISDALEKIGRLCVLHNNFHDVLEGILTELEYGATDSIIVVPGPTGIGKTHLAKILCKRLSEFAESANRGKPIYVEAETAHGGGFKWRDLYLDVMHELDEPCIDLKTELDKVLQKLREGAPMPSSYKTTYSAARRSMNACIEQSAPVAVIIDEAQHIGTSYPSLSGGRYLDVCKGLANKKNTCYVLLGTLEIECMLNTSAQISKRTNVIDFKRYLRTKTGITAVLTALNESIRQLQLKVTFNLGNYAFEIFDGTLGCIGLLIEWLERAMKRAKKSNRNELHWDDFEKSRLSHIKLETMAREIEAYREATERSGPFEYHKHFKLHQGEIRSPASNSELEKSKPSGSRKPGARKTGRDPVS